MKGSTVPTRLNCLAMALACLALACSSSKGGKDVGPGAAGASGSGAGGQGGGPEGGAGAGGSSVAGVGGGGAGSGGIGGGVAGAGGSGAHGGADGGTGRDTGVAGAGGGPAADAGRDVAQGSADASGGPGTCPSPVRADPQAAKRAACTFRGGATSAETIGITAQERAAIPIKHVIVIMKENRSYDHILGQLATRGQPDSEAIPASYTTRAGKPTHATTTCQQTDPPHEWKAMHDFVNGGKMDGFGASSMAFYDSVDLPFYYWLANTFAVGDRYFPSLLGPTVPNRVFSLFATAWGMKDNSDPKPPKTTTHILDLLDRKGVDWAVYAEKGAFDNTINGWPGVAEHKHPIADFKTAAKNGTLPSFSWVDAIPYTEDEHPSGDMQVGEAWTRDIVQAVLTSPQWSSAALFITYDEGGGFFDHVPPPSTCPPADGSPNQEMYTELGIRVPLYVVSPWARRHYVSHVVHEHTSILRFAETVFDLPALTARDANSDALLDMFDFACPNTAPAPAPPAAGTGGCH